PSPPADATPSTRSDTRPSSSRARTAPDTDAACSGRGPRPAPSARLPGAARVASALSVLLRIAAVSSLFSVRAPYTERPARRARVGLSVARGDQPRTGCLTLRLRPPSLQRRPQVCRRVSATDQPARPRYRQRVRGIERTRRQIIPPGLPRGPPPRL